LAYHTPLIETEVLKEHSHQVLHVSFSHNGKMFATCSKDGYILVSAVLFLFHLQPYMRECMRMYIYTYIFAVKYRLRYGKVSIQLQ